MWVLRAYLYYLSSFTTTFSIHYYPSPTCKQFLAFNLVLLCHFLQTVQEVCVAFWSKSWASFWAIHGHFPTDSPSTSAVYFYSCFFTFTQATTSPEQALHALFLPLQKYHALLNMTCQTRPLKVYVLIHHALIHHFLPFYSVARSWGANSTDTYCGHTCF